MSHYQGIFRSGTSGLVLAEPNKKHFPEEFQARSRLSYYASKFNSIEINSSFYKIPRCQTYSNWFLQVPKDFQFSIKLWKGITHNREFGFHSEDVEKFFSALNCLGEKKGCLLIQLPAGSTMDVNQFRQMLEQVKKKDPDGYWRLAIEFRHNRWYEKSIFNLIAKYGASLVLHDMPNSFIHKLQGEFPFVYLRFHGENGDYRGSYDAPIFCLTKQKKLKIGWGRALMFMPTSIIPLAVQPVNLETLNKMVKSL